MGHMHQRPRKRLHTKVVVGEAAGNICCHVSPGRLPSPEEIVALPLSEMTQIEETTRLIYDYIGAS